MAWGPSEVARERILVYGDMGVGKTKGALDIAQRLVGTDGRMFVVDSDRSWDRMVPREWLADGTVKVWPARGWEDQARGIEKAMGQVGEDDWLVVDSSSRLWDDVAKWYIRKVHGRDMPEWMVQHRIEQVKDPTRKATAGQDATLIEWNYINPLWHRAVTENLIWAPCHVYVTAEAGELRSDGKDQAVVKKHYRDVGYKPRTQKGLGFACHTVLFMDRSSAGNYRMLTVKDRQDSRGDRRQFGRDPWGDFFTDYLRGVAGWKHLRAGSSERDGARGAAAHSSH